MTNETLINGLTEAETAATASVAGIVQPATVTDEQIEAFLPKVRHRPGMIGYDCYAFGDVTVAVRAALAAAPAPDATAAGVPTDNERMFRRALQWVAAVEDRFGLEKAREIARETLAAAASVDATAAGVPTPKAIATEDGIRWQAGAWSVEKTAVTVDGRTWYRDDHKKAAPQEAQGQQAAPSTKPVRLLDKQAWLALTEEHIDMCATATFEAIQRKFCEVNSLAIGSTTTEAKP